MERIHSDKVCVGRAEVNERELMQSRAKQMILIFSKISSHHRYYLGIFWRAWQHFSHSLHAKPIGET